MTALIMQLTMMRETAPDCPLGDLNMIIGQGCAPCGGGGECGVSRPRS